MSTSAPVFELERFSAAPVSGDVAVVEVGGRFGNGELNGDTPRLLVEAPDGAQIELPALGPIAGPAGRWQASFAVPADRLAGGSAFALALRDLLLDLPDPDTDGGDGDRLVALARELNARRRDLDIAREQAQSADARVAEVRTQAQADKDRALSESAARMETALREARERTATDVKAAAKARDDAHAELATVRARAEQAEGERQALADELRDARRAQKATRAEIEALRRERDALARELEKAAPSPAPEEAATQIAEPVDLDGPAVKVIGRQGPRRASPTEVLPPVDAELPPAPPILSYIVASVMFVIFVVVLMLLLI